MVYPHRTYLVTINMALTKPWDSPWTWVWVGLGVYVTVGLWRNFLKERRATGTHCPIKTDAAY